MKVPIVLKSLKFKALFSLMNRLSIVLNEKWIFRVEAKDWKVKWVNKFKSEHSKVKSHQIKAGK